jgi:hypothetical protein
VRHDPPRIVWAGRVWTSDMEVPMPAYPPLPGNVQTHSYSENGVLHVDVVVDHVVVQTVSLDLHRLIEHRRMIAAEAAGRPAVQIDPASLAGTSATTNAHYWPAKED